jgi:4-amino-4-deoxy-L-arabinose transferase-like glycosyltransferase
LDLHPDEAQYWSWSRDLTWGYFSKPPMIAWLIATSTTVCGAGEGCVKASIPILHFVTALLVYGIGRRLYDRAIGFFAALTFMTLPGISFSATVASTDPPLLTFWALALYALVRLIQNAAHPYLWWVVLGVGIGFGLLSKYAMAFFILGLVLWLVLDSDARARLRIPGPGILGLAMALALGGMIYLPNLIWNIESGFVTFVHTGANANLKGSLFHPAELGAFLASQFGVFGPVLFAALLWFGIQVAVRRPQPVPRSICSAHVAHDHDTGTHLACQCQLGGAGLCGRQCMGDSGFDGRRARRPEARANARADARFSWLAQRCCRTSGGRHCISRDHWQIAYPRRD